MRNFIDEIAPEHGRTSCSDDASHGNEFFNERGYPRCVRCALLYRARHGEWPYGATFHVDTLRTLDGVALREGAAATKGEEGGR